MGIRVRSFFAFILAIIVFFVFSSIIHPPRRHPTIDKLSPLNVQDLLAHASSRHSQYGILPTRVPKNSHTESLTFFDSVSTPSQSQATPAPILINDDIRLLIGVMSPFTSSHRRQIIRNAYRQFPKDLPVDVWFVAGDVYHKNEYNRDKVLQMQSNATRWENNTYHDIMKLPCLENLEDGKTYEYLKKVGLEFSDKYTHVMKTDDDSFVNIPGLPLHTVIADYSTSSNPPRKQKSRKLLLGHNLVRRIALAS